MGMRQRNRFAVAFCAVFFVLPLAACTGQPDQPATAASPPSPTEVVELSTPTAAVPDLEALQQVAGQIVWLRSTNPYGHTGIKLESEGKVIYVDPVDLVGLDNLPKADWILITHDHGDHFSIKTIAALSKPGTVAVSIKQVQYSLSSVKFFALAPGETVDAGGLQVRGVPAYNDSHPKELGYLGFIFTIQGVRIYCSGDTGLTPEMQALRGIDIAVMNVRNPYSLTGQDVVEFARAVKPKIIIPIHWMPDDKTYGDQAEIDYLRQNIPDTTVLMELELTP
jgi:L-ascorbate metabolism protein UlaG (beta-lactamase superfamily)